MGQTRAMLELMQYPEKEIALITITTGMNIQEIYNLQWKHINLTESERYLDGELVPSKNIAAGAHWNRAGLGDWKRGRRRKSKSRMYCSQSSGIFSAGKVLRIERNSPDFRNGPPGCARRRLCWTAKPIGRKLGIPWLSWHVLRRAHTGFLLGFRSQLNKHIAHLSLNNPK